MNHEKRSLEFYVLAIFFTIFVLFLYGPLSAIVILSFQGPDGGLTFPLNGVSLHWVTMSAKPVDLDWKGAHTGVTFSPDGNFLVTSMQENALHGWKLDTKPGAEARHMRMTGYPAKVKSLSWSVKGKWLASSGAPAAIVWPFQGKDGPMGKAPLELGTRANIMATSVKFHPLEDILAIGFIDGMILAVRISDSKEALLRRPGKGAITAMSWSGNGKLLAFASEAGDCGVIDISA